MPLNVVLFQPEIPPNTGNVIRLCANTGARLHLVKPLGFRLDARAVRRAGLDYHDLADVAVHAALTACLTAWRRRGLDGRWFALTTRGGVTLRHRRASSAVTSLVFGPETRGLPDAVAAMRVQRTRRLRIPMLAGARSLNLSNAVAVVGVRSLAAARLATARAAQCRLLIAAAAGSRVRLLRFRLDRAAHQCAHRVARRRAFVNDAVDLLGDRHLDAVVCARPRAPRAPRARPRRPGRSRAAPARSVLPDASARPKRRLRDWSSVQVSTRSPRPASPMNVSFSAPNATPRRIISASPRVISATRVLAPKPRPSEMPAPIASTFLVAPPTSTPTTSCRGVRAEIHAREPPRERHRVMPRRGRRRSSRWAGPRRLRGRMSAPTAPPWARAGPSTSAGHLVRQLAGLEFEAFRGPCDAHAGTQQRRNRVEAHRGSRDSAPPCSSSSALRDGACRFGFERSAVGKCAPGR